ncbi:MAG: hypothetical protein Q6M04_09140 [Thermostichus sp. BF3_bins_97]
MQDVCCCGENADPVLDQGTFCQVFGPDRRAVEEEQRAYHLHHQDLSRETNPASHAVRQVIRKQTVGCSPLPEWIPG